MRNELDYILEDIKLYINEHPVLPEGDPDDFYQMMRDALSAYAQDRLYDEDRLEDLFAAYVRDEDTDLNKLCPYDYAKAFDIDYIEEYENTRTRKSFGRWLADQVSEYLDSESGINEDEFLKIPHIQEYLNDEFNKFMKICEDEGITKEYYDFEKDSTSENHYALYCEILYNEASTLAEIIFNKYYCDYEEAEAARNFERELEDDYRDATGGDFWES